MTGAWHLPRKSPASVGKVTGEVVVKLANTIYLPSVSTLVLSLNYQITLSQLFHHAFISRYTFYCIQHIVCTRMASSKPLPRWPSYVHNNNDLQCDMYSTIPLLGLWLLTADQIQFHISVINIHVYYVSGVLTYIDCMGTKLRICCVCEHFSYTTNHILM